MVEGDGIHANVEWTMAGAEHVQAKGYRYLSPVVLVRKSDKRAVELHSVALTNKPAIVAMQPIVNSASATTPDRATMIRNAAATWRTDLGLQKLTTSLESFIDGELMAHHRDVMTASERRDLTAPGAAAREFTINRATAEYDRESTLQALCSREAYIEDQLRAAGLSDEPMDADRELIAGR